MQRPLLSAVLIGSLTLAACSGQPTPPSPSPTPPVVTPPGTHERMKIRAIKFKDAKLAAYMQYFTQGLTEMYADEVTTLHLPEVGSLDGLAYFIQLKALTVDGVVKNSVDLSANGQLETLEIKADSLVLSKNNVLTQLRAEVQHIELPSAGKFIQLQLTHGSVASPDSKTLYSANKNPTLNKGLKLDLSNQPQLTQLSLKGQFEEVVLPSASQLERFTLSGAPTAIITGLPNQKSLKSLTAVLAKNTVEFNLNMLPQLEELDITADGLVSFDIHNLPNLRGLSLSGENLKQFISDKNQPGVRWMRISAPKLPYFDLFPYSKLESFEFGNGQLSYFSLPNAPLTTLKLGDNPIKTFSVSYCGSLISLEMGYSQLASLDLTRCKSLGFAYILPSTAQPQDPLINQLKLPEGAVRDVPESALRRISKLTANDIPDVRLLSCVQSAAEAEKALYTAQLKNLTCRGSDGKRYYQAFDSRQQGLGYSMEKLYIYNTSGLDLLTGLETLDLSINWIDKLHIDGLVNLKSLILDGNIIQAVYFSNMQALRQLSLSSNPLRAVQLPVTLNQFTANPDFIDNAYVTYILGRYNLDILREGVGGAFLTTESFSQKFSLENALQANSLAEIKADRIDWPAITLPGVERLRVKDLAIADKNLQACIGNQFTFADEVKSISCVNRGRGEYYFIRSLAGLEQFKNLREIFLYGHELGVVDLSPLKALKKINITDTNVTSINFGQNPGLEEVSFIRYLSTNQKPIELDFSRNARLRNINLQGVNSVKLPESDTVEFLSLQMRGDGIYTAQKLPDLDLSRFSHLYSLELDHKLANLRLPEQSVLEHFSYNGTAAQKIENLSVQTHLVTISVRLPNDIERLDLSAFSQLRSVYFESEVLNQLTLPTASKLTQLQLHTPELTALSTINLGSLERLTLNTPKLAQLNTSTMPQLAELTVSEYAFKNLDVSTLGQLKQLTLGDGTLQQLTLGNNAKLESLTFGNGNLKTLDFAKQVNLKQLSLGRNPLKILDLQANRLLESLTYSQPAPAEIRLPQLDYELPITIVPEAKKIAQLTAADMPDAVLRKCVVKAAAAQSVIYADELTQLACTGLDAKTRVVSMGMYINNESLENYDCCIFDVKGLALLSNLKSLDLTGNWISQIKPDDLNLQRLRSLVLDHNAIQTLEVPWGFEIGNSAIVNQLQRVSLNANPLVWVNLPSNVHYLSATAGDAWAYTGITLINQYSKAPLLDINTGQPLKLSDYSRPFSLQYLGGDLQVNSTKLAP